MTELLYPIPVADPPRNPLDPLTPSELQFISTLVKSTAVFQSDPCTIIDYGTVTIDPPKEYVQNFKPGDKLIRVANVNTYSPTYDKYYTYHITLRGAEPPTRAKVVRESHRTRPAWTFVENDELVAVCIANAEYRAAIKRRGITDEQLDNGQVQPNTLVDGRLDGKCCKKGLPNLEGNPEEGEERPRSYYANTLIMDPPNGQPQLLGNWYLQPLANSGQGDQGLWAWFDANLEPTGQVIKIIDLPGSGEYIKTNQGLLNINTPPNAYCNDYRHTLKPIFMSQPDGPSFHIDQNVLFWQRWKTMFEMNPITGLILRKIQYNDVKNQTDPPNYRPIIYQAGLSEAATVYGDGDFGIKSFNFLDCGEYPQAAFGSPMQLGIDVPNYALLYNPVYLDDKGNLFQLPGGLAIWEEDGGEALWTHYEFNTGVVQGRRARNLVFGYKSTIGNYDYTYFTKFKLDGSISTTVQPSGILELAPGLKSKETAPLVYKNLVGPNHQHFFNFRINFEVDGNLNRIYETNAEPIPSCCNNEWTDKDTLLKTSGESARNVNPRTGREWLVQNHKVKTSLGYHPGYAIQTYDSTKAMANDKARIIKRCPFMKTTLYVTEYKNKNGQYFSGNHPVEKGHSTGIIPERDQCDNIVDKDLVVWLTLSFVHSPIPENFPVLNGEILSFDITPSAFFDQNPAMDVDINTLIGPTYPINATEVKKLVRRYIKTKKDDKKIVNSSLDEKDQRGSK